MAVFGTADAQVLMPRNIANGMVTQVRSTSTVAKLSGAEPQRFGNEDILIFNTFPKAEFVGEGAAKSSSSGGFTSVTAVPHKAQVTMRFNQEVQWLDEDYQLGVLNTLGDAGGVALSRALDLGLYHRINPLTGAALTWTNYLDATVNSVELTATTDWDVSFRTAVGILVNGATPYIPNGSAFSPQFAWNLSSLMAKDGAGVTSQPRYPQLGYGTNIASFGAIPVAQGDTVAGTPEATDTKVRAYVGDFQNGIRWGIQRDLPIELIRYGDPDGQGDLKRNNQIALRLEIVYGWYVFTERFVKIIDAVAG